METILCLLKKSSLCHLCLLLESSHILAWKYLPRDTWRFSLRTSLWIARPIYIRIGIISCELKPLETRKWNGYPRRVVESVVKRKRRNKRGDSGEFRALLLVFRFLITVSSCRLHLSSIHCDFLVDECALIAALLILRWYNFNSWRLLFHRMLIACPIQVLTSDCLSNLTVYICVCASSEFPGSSIVRIEVDRFGHVCKALG